MSWRNPNAEQKELTFADLITQGSVEALRVIEEITGEKRPTALATVLVVRYLLRLKPITWQNA